MGEDLVDGRTGRGVWVQQELDEFYRERRELGEESGVDSVLSFPDLHAEAEVVGVLERGVSDEQGVSEDAERPDVDWE